MTGRAVLNMYRGQLVSMRRLAMLTGIHEDTIRSWQVKYGSVSQSRVERHLQRRAEAQRLVELARAHGVKPGTYRQRVHRGMDPNDAATLPNRR